MYEMYSTHFWAKSLFHLVEKGKRKWVLGDLLKKTSSKDKPLFSVSLLPLFALLCTEICAVRQR